MKFTRWLKALCISLLLCTSTFHPMEEFVNIEKLPIHNLSQDFASLFTLLGKYAEKRNYGALEQDLILGAACNYALLNNDQAFIQAISDPKVQPHAIRGLIWFYYLLGAKKNQAFQEGTFTIIHPRAQSVLNFLNHFPHKGLIELLQVKLPTLKSTPESYERISSHFKAFMQETGKKEPHFGLDIDQLPEGKQTLLYGMVDKERNLIFIKPENFGTLDIVSLAIHGLDWFKSIAVKSPLKNYLGDWLPSDDDPKNRKERIPSALLKSYIDFINAIERTKLLKGVEEFEKEAAAYGIQKMQSNLNFLVSVMLTDFRKKARPENKQAFGDLIDQGNAVLREIKQYDHLQYRFGREVILTKQEFAIITPADYEKLKAYALKVIIPNLKKA